MKYRTTQKAVRETNGRIIKTGYCAIQHLINYKSPAAYTCGVYGWNADIYYINGVCIVTGYRPFGNIVPGYEVNYSYDEKARTICNSLKPYKEKSAALDCLIDEYLREVLHDGN